jgi:hypothetical protein
MGRGTWPGRTDPQICSPSPGPPTCRTERGGVIKLPSTSLEDTFTNSGAPSVIDYFPFDIEGAEAIVLQNFPMVHIISTTRSIHEGKDKWVTHAQPLRCLQGKYTFLTLAVAITCPDWSRMTTL